MNVFERRNYPVISLLKYLSYYIMEVCIEASYNGSYNGVNGVIMEVCIEASYSLVSSSSGLKVPREFPQ
jgi:hypothetical protein